VIYTGNSKSLINCAKLTITETEEVQNLIQYMDINNQLDYDLDLINPYEFNEAEVRIEINDVGPSAPIASLLQSLGAGAFSSHSLYPGSSMIVGNILTTRCNHQA